MDWLVCVEHEHSRGSKVENDTTRYLSFKRIFSVRTRTDAADGSFSSFGLIFPHRTDPRGPFAASKLV